LNFQFYIKEKTVIRDVLEVLISSLIIVFIVKKFLFTTYFVPSASMEPVININEKIIVSLLEKKIDIGDVVAFSNPDIPKVKMVKRVAGLPGDVVEVRDRKLFINNTHYSKWDGIDCILIDPENLEYVMCAEIPENSFFLIGDNIYHSRDSRSWGFVPEKNIIGKVKAVYWPLTRFRIIK